MMQEIIRTVIGGLSPRFDELLRTAPQRSDVNVLRHRRYPIWPFCAVARRKPAFDGVIRRALDRRKLRLSRNRAAALTQSCRRSRGRTARWSRRIRRQDAIRHERPGYYRFGLGLHQRVIQGSRCTLFRSALGPTVLGVRTSAGSRSPKRGGVDRLPDVAVFTLRAILQRQPNPQAVSAATGLRTVEIMGCCCVLRWLTDTWKRSPGRIQITWTLAARHQTATLRDGTVGDAMTRDRSVRIPSTWFFKRSGASHCSPRLICSAVAVAQDAPDFGRLAQFVRWSGVAFSLPIIVQTLLFCGSLKTSPTRFGVPSPIAAPRSKKLIRRPLRAVHLATVAVCVG